MSFLKIQKFYALFETKLPQVQLQSFFKSFEKKYKTSFNFDSYTNVIDRINKTNKRETEKNNFQAAEKEEDKAESFVFGQFKIFTWVLVVYCNSHGITLEELNQQHFTEIQEVFQSKSLIFIRYQTLCLIHQKQKFQRKWAQPEIELLTSIITFKNNPNQWRIISFQLFKQSQGEFYRPFQQCREKWFNYLDPKVNRGDWTEEEDIALLSAADFLGCKWAVISRQLGGVRTQHMVKNRFKSLISKWKKKFKKTNPQKLLSYILKQLKKKSDKTEEAGLLNWPDHSYVFQQQSVMQDQIKKQCININKEQDQFLQPITFVTQNHHEIKQRSKDEEEEEFDLGLENMEEQKEWKVDNQPGQEKMLMNYMRYRGDNFVWELEEKQQRKTSQNCQQQGEHRIEIEKKSQEEDHLVNLFDFSGQNYLQQNVWQSPSHYWAIDNTEDSEWLRNIQQRNFLSWIDDSN